jgi:hypothetical protein
MNDPYTLWNKLDIWQKIYIHTLARLMLKRTRMIGGSLAVAVIVFIWLYPAPHAGVAALLAGYYAAFALILPR